MTQRQGCNKTWTCQQTSPKLKSDQVSNLLGGAVQQVPCKQAAYPGRLVNQVGYTRLRL